MQTAQAACEEDSPGLDLKYSITGWLIFELAAN